MSKTAKNEERPIAVETQLSVLLGIYNQNCEHFRHLETERGIFLQVQSAIYAAILIDITRGAIDLFVNFGLILLLGLSVSAFLISIKIEAVIETYLKRNQELVKVMESLTHQEIHHLAASRVTHGIWKYIRLRYVIPMFYLFVVIISAALVVYRL